MRNPNKTQRPEEFSTVNVWTKDKKRIDEASKAMGVSTREYITVLLDKAHLDKRDILRARIAELQAELEGQDAP